MPHLVVLREKGLHSVRSDILTVKGVVPFLKGKAMVPYKAGLRQQAVKSAVLP